MPLAVAGVVGLTADARAQLTFSGPTPYLAGTDPDRLVVADFNGDNDLDAAVGLDAGVAILVGGAGATFGQPATITVPNPADLTVGDVNRDGDPDLAVANSSSQVEILLGGPGAGFSGPTGFPTTEEAEDVVIGNFNPDQDQNPDLAVTSGNGLVGVVSVLPGAGNGTFGQGTDYSIGGLLQSLVSRDFNGDGDLDLAVADINGSRVSVFTGGTGMAFASPPTDFPAANAAYIGSDDFNGDGDPDIAVTNFSGDPPNLWALTGGAGASFSGAVPFPVGALPLGIAVGRIDADTDPDVVTANNSDSSLSVLTGAAGASFAPAATLPNGAQPRDVVLGDFNRDGKTDIAATAEAPTNGMTVFVNTGPGATQPPPPPPPGGGPKHLVDLPAPKLGRQVNVEAIKGTVLIALPARGAHAAQKGLRFVPLEEARQIPVGSYLDTKRGTVQMVTATGSGAKTQDGKWTAGIFQVLQSRKKREKGLTELRLSGGSFKKCSRPRRGKRASAAALSKRTIRKLKSSAKGRFRTRGRHSAATVRGTIWLTADRCDGTLTKVTRGTVAVRDLRRRKTVLVRAGKSYLARAKR
jgi:hypothetical protein